MDGRDLGINRAGRLATRQSTVLKNTLDLNNLVFFTDFMGGSGDWQLANSGAGSATNIGVTGSTTQTPGIIQFVTGTTTTGRANYRWQGGAILLGGGAWVFETYVRIPTLSVLAERFLCIWGFSDFGDGNPTDGVYIRHSDNVNSGKFECVTRSNSVESAVDSAITVVANQWYKLRIEINALATSAVFKIDGATVATVATNIPTGVGRETGLMGTVVKQLGTTSRTMEADYAYANNIVTTSR